MQAELGAHPECEVAWRDNQAFLWGLRTRLVARADEIFGDRETFVYFVASDAGPIKIGAAAKPRYRLKNLQVGSVSPLRLLCYCRGTFALERFLHDEFADSRLDGEWFARTPELLATISEFVGVEDMCRDIDLWDEPATVAVDVRAMFVDKCMDFIERFACVPESPVRATGRGRA